MGTLDGKLVGPAFGGGTRDRTADLLHAMQALSQLSYTPAAKEGRIIWIDLVLVKSLLRLLEILGKAGGDLLAADQGNDRVDRRGLCLAGQDDA